MTINIARIMAFVILWYNINKSLQEIQSECNSNDVYLNIIYAYVNITNIKIAKNQEYTL